VSGFSRTVIHGLSKTVQSFGDGAGKLDGSIKLEGRPALRMMLLNRTGDFFVDAAHRSSSAF